jgi:hypothetical protein
MEYIKITCVHIFKQFYKAPFKTNLYFNPKYLKVSSWIPVFANLGYHINLIIAV